MKLRVHLLAMKRWSFSEENTLEQGRFETAYGGDLQKL